jgi:peptidoglycan hydrolase CwlO-like protein
MASVNSSNINFSNIAQNYVLPALKVACIKAKDYVVSSSMPFIPKECSFKEAGRIASLVGASMPVMSDLYYYYKGNSYQDQLTNLSAQAQTLPDLQPRIRQLQNEIDAIQKNRTDSAGMKSILSLLLGLYLFGLILLIILLAVAFGVHTNISNDLANLKSNLSRLSNDFTQMNNLDNSNSNIVHVRVS